VHHDAPHADIKKSFYRLSKAHHPDANPNDPTASHTFSLIAESYNVLSDATRRAAYDRDVLRLQHHHHSHAHKGSYHSAGGRPASGLSRRRGTFRGPPPSFYRAGGYGAHSDKRRRAHEESTASQGATNNKEGETTSSTFSSASSSSEHFHSHHGGMGPGDDPFGHHEEVPHFDRDSHQRTQRREDERRSQRAQHHHSRKRRAVDDENIEFEPQMSIGAHFMVVLGILATSFAVPALYLRFARSNRKTTRDGTG